MSTRKLHGSWWVDFRHQRVRCRKKSPDNSKTGAQAYEAVLRQRIARGEPLEPIKETKERIPTFREFSDHWFKTYVITNNKYSEQQGKRTVLNTHLLPFFGKIPLTGITLLKIEEFKALGLKKGLCSKTVNNHLNTLRKCLNDAHEWEILEKVPKIKMLKVPPPQSDFLSQEESKKLLSVIDDPFWYSMVLVALRTGLRLGELRGLRWENINLNTRMLTVKQAVVIGRVVSPKSNKARHIPLTTDVCYALRTRAHDNGWVFTLTNDRPLNHKITTNALNLYCESAGLRHIGWHKLRHTFASHLMMSGVSIKAIQELLGHSDIQTTMRYAHLGASSLRSAIAVLEPKNSESIHFGQQVGNNTIFPFQTRT